MGVHLLSIAISVVFSLVNAIGSGSKKKRRRRNYRREKSQPPEHEKLPSGFKSDSISSNYAQEVGKAGEDDIEEVIHQVCAENRHRYQLLRKVYLPKGDGETSEIDLLLLHETGIFKMV